MLNAELQVHEFVVSLSRVLQQPRWFKQGRTLHAAPIITAILLPSLTHARLDYLTLRFLLQLRVELLLQQPSSKENNESLAARYCHTGVPD